MPILIELWIFFCSHKVKSNHFKSAADRDFTLDLLGFPGFYLLAAGAAVVSVSACRCWFWWDMSRSPALLVAGCPVARLPVARLVQFEGGAVSAYYPLGSQSFRRRGWSGLGSGLESFALPCGRLGAVQAGSAAMLSAGGMAPGRGVA
jgi:hypothetical protein